MPYIKKEKREPIINLINKLDLNTLSYGDLNFLITKMLKDYINIHGENYNNYNSIIGLLECIKLEFYRTDVSIYEDIKMVENGKV